MPPAAPQPTYPDVLLMHEPDAFTFRVPCQGDIFDFTVVASCTWRATRQAAAPHLLPALRQRAQNRRPSVQAAMPARVRVLSRSYHPLAVAELERALNSTAERLVAFEGGALQCEVTMRVGYDDAIRDQLRKVRLPYLVQEHREAAAREQVQRVARQLPEWTQLLDGLAAATTDPSALRVALRPEDLEGVLEKRVGRPDRERERLFRVVEQALQAYKQADMYEFALETDTALVALMRHLGLPVHDSTFVPRDGTGGPRGSLANGEVDYFRAPRT
jgi:hypothetical protein